MHDSDNLEEINLPCHQQMCVSFRERRRFPHMSTYKNRGHIKKQISPLVKLIIYK
jgi:hypothetical protein